MADGVKVQADDYRRLNAAIKALDDRKLARIYRKRLREAAGPLGRLVLEKGAAQMPRRGGLAARLMASPVGVSQRSTGIDLWLGSKRKSQVSAINRRGAVRHPVYGHRDRKWAETKVPEAAFTKALEELGPEATKRLSVVLDDIMKELKL